MRKALLATVVVLVLTAGAVLAAAQTGYLPRVDRNASMPTPTGTATPSSTPTPTPAGDVLAAPATVVQAPNPAVLAARLDPLLRLPALGPDSGAVVLDSTTGATVYARRSATPQVPASTAKLFTAAAALATLPSTEGLETRVVTGSAAGQVVLVGGGDSTLTATPQPQGAYPRGASLAQLAERTAAALRAAGQGHASVAIDDSLFAGPAWSPAWPPSYLASGVVAPVMALMIDEGRIRPGFRARSRDPALAAGARFATLLAGQGIRVSGPVPRVRASTTATVLAAVESPAVPVLVEHMLNVSDNDLAESLARLAARASGHPASFAGFTYALPSILARLGVPGSGVRLVDGSGLARSNLVTAQALGALLSRAVSGGDPKLRPLLTGLPVGGFTGTLAGRYTRGPAAAAAGEVRAKTGTLTGVSSLAGTAADQSGALLIFAVLADRVPDGLGARAVLDRFAGTLAACGCN